LPPRQADLTEEEEQPIYSETFDGGDYEELLERSDYCDSVSAGADYEELPGPVGKPGATYSLGEEDEGADYDEVIPEESSQSQPCSGERGGKSLRECLFASLNGWTDREGFGVLKSCGQVSGPCWLGPGCIPAPRPAQRCESEA